MPFVYIKFLHLTALVLLFAASAYKNVQLNAQYCDHKLLKKILVADRLSALSATLMVITGLAMLLKGYPVNLFRLHQTVFWIKIGILGLTTSLIIMSKLTLRRIAHDHESMPNSRIFFPRSIKFILGIDLIGLVLMAALASFMVRY
jgi:uncharacterized membrane protein